MSETPSPREKLLDAAERLFDEHGFAAVKLRHIEQASGLHHATFYHHAPGGKVQLFLEATERSLARHEEALRARVSQHAGDLRLQLSAVAAWVLSHPAGNHSRLLSTDLPNLPPEAAERLARRAYEGLIGPVAGALRDAHRSGQIVLEDALVETVAGALLASLQALHSVHTRYDATFSPQAQADGLIGVLLHGLFPRKEDGT